MEVWGPLNQVKSPSGSYCDIVREYIWIWVMVNHGHPPQSKALP